MNKRWLLSTMCGLGLFAGSAGVAVAQNVPGENATAPTGTGAATQAVTLKPGEEAGTNTVMPADTAANPNASTQDARFVLRASAGGKAEVMMGNLAMQKGQTAAERAYGQMLVTDHTQADDQLMGIAEPLMLKTAAHPAHMQQAMYRQLESLPSDQFDAAFNQDMIQAHRETIALFKMEAHDGQNPSLRQFAMSTLPVLYRHLHMAEQLSPMHGPGMTSTSDMSGPGGMSTMPQTPASLDAPVHGNPDHSADQLNARELTSGNPS